MNFKLTSSTFYLSAAFILFALIGAIGYATYQAEPASADLEAINQCYDYSNNSQALIQVGLFVTQSDYRVDTGLQVGDIIKNGWSYTYFSGNSPEEIVGLRLDLGETNAKVANRFGSESVEAILDLPSVGKYTILAYGSGTDTKQPIQFGNFVDDLTPVSDGKGKVRIIHASGFHSNVNNLVLDVQHNAGEEEVINNLEFGGQGYFEVEPGNVKIRAVDQSGNFSVFDIKPFNVNEGELVTLILYGDDADSMDVYTLVDCQSVYRYNQLVSKPQFPEFNGEINFVNLAPTSSQLAETELSLTMNGGVQFESQPYGSSSGSKEIEASTYTAQLKAAGSNIVVAQATAEIEIGKSYTLVASGGADGAEYDLTVLESAWDSVPAGFGGLRFGNFVSDGVEPSNLRFVDETSIGFELNDIAYKKHGLIEFYVSDSDIYDFEIQRGPQTLIDPRTIDIEGGTAVNLFASGNGVEQPYGVFHMVEGQMGEFVPLEAARLYVAHLAPFAQNLEESDVTLKINGQLISDFSRYGDSTGYLSLPAGSNTISVEQNGTSLASRQVDLAGNQDYSMFLIGSDESVGFTTLLEDVPFNSGDAAIRFGNVAPELETLNFSDFSTVWAYDLSFGQIQDRLIRKTPGNLNLSVKNNQAVEIIDPAAVSLSAGDVATFLAVADASLNEHAVYAVINGQKGQFLDPDSNVANLYIANLLALDSTLEDPSIMIRLNGEQILTGMQFGTSTPGLIEIPVGAGLIEVLPSNSTLPILTKEIETENDGVYRLIIHGNASTAEMDFTTQLNEAKEGVVRILAGNMVPPESGFLSSVNIYQNETLLAGGIESGEMQTRFSPSTTNKSVFRVTTSDGVAVLLESPEISLADNSAVTLIAAGDGGINQPFGLFAIINQEPMVLLPSQEGEASAPPKLTIAHFAPFAPGAASRVAIRLNDVIIDADFQYGDLLIDTQGAIGSNKIEILDATSLAVLKTANSPFLTSENPYFYFVSGGANGLDVTVFGFQFEGESSAETADVSFFNAASIMESVTDRRMDLVLVGGEEQAISDVKFGNSASGDIPSGDYDPILMSPDGLRSYANPELVTVNQNGETLFVSAGDGNFNEVSLFQFRYFEGMVTGTKIENELDQVDFSNIIFLPLIVR